MRRRCFPFLLLFTTWCVTVLGTANAQDVHEKFWRSYSEIGLRGGDIFESGQGNLFLPVHQTEVSMLFGDIRGNWTDARSSHGNFGVGFRQMLICDWIFGINGFYDIKHSSYGNNFHQGALGLEMLHPNWGVRWNGYLAGEDAKLVPSFNQASLVGNNLFIQQAAERAYSGLDFEIESRLWSHEGPGDEAWGAWMTSYDVELWGAIGVYNYDNDAAGFGELTGPRARIELRILDVPFGGPDSRLVFAGQYEDDDVRGDVSSAMVSLRIPFGRGTRSPRGRLRGLNRRMVAPIMRNTDIISVASLGAPEPAAFASTGQAISQVVTVDPTTVGPEGVIAAAGNDSLVIVDGGASGTILPGGTINVQPGQTVLGGGGRVAVRGLNSGASAVFQASGSRPLIDSAANTTFLAADNSTISSLGITNSGAGQSGVLINGATGARIENVGINVSGASAFGIQANGSSVFTLSDSSINTSGDLGDGVQLLGDSEGVIRGSAIGTSGLNAEGVFAADTSFLSFQQSRIFTSGSGGSEGIQAVGSSQVIVSNSVVTTTGPSTSAIAAAPSGAGDALAIQVSGSTINATGSGVALGGSGFAAGSLDATVFGNLIATPTGEPAIDATTNGVAIMNLSAQGNAIDPIAGTIRLNALGGDLNVTQTAVGIASENALPVTNILIPGGPINFNAPPPIPPSR